MADIKSYRPASSSVGSGQVLQCAYRADKARLVLREMADALALDLFERGLVTDQLVLTVCYDVESLSVPDAQSRYHGAVTTDRYGRRTPKPAHGSENLGAPTASVRQITQAASALFDRVVDPALLVRRIYLTANHTLPREQAAQMEYRQLDFFSDEAQTQAEQLRLARERRMQEAILAIRHKYGKNAIVKAMSFQDGATARQRNGQIGGHRA